MNLRQYTIQQKLWNKVVRACQHLLISSDKAIQARTYLNKRISKQDQILWKFGYFPSNDHLKDLTDIVDKKDLESLQLYYHNGLAPHGHFSDHNLVMPFYDVHGNVIALLGRCLLTEEQRQENLLNKYKYTMGCQKDMFVYGLDKAVDHIISEDFVICVEGQFDCIALHAQGIKNAVALGWASMSKFQMFQVQRYTDNIFLMLDNDEAGQKSKKRIKDRYKVVSNMKTLSVPEGYKDIDEFFHKSKESYVLSVIDDIKNINFRRKDGKKV
jgi:DNA primase